MPTPKAGTVTEDLAKAVGEVKAGRLEFKVDKSANLACPWEDQLRCGETFAKRRSRVDHRDEGQARFHQRQLLVVRIHFHHHGPQCEMDLKEIANLA